MKNRKLSFAAQLMIMTAALMLAANALLGMALIKKSGASIKTLINNRMLDIANTAADMLDGDALGTLRAEDKDTEAYRKINDTLVYFQDNIELKYIYCVRDMGDKTFTFTVDPTVEDPGEFGEPVVYTDALYMASLGKASVDDIPYSDDWGNFYSAYSPVFDSDGNVSGIVAVDFDAGWYEEQLSDQRRSIIMNSLLSMTVGVLLIVISTGGMRKKLQAITDDLYEVAESVDDLKKAISPESRSVLSGEKTTADVAELSKNLRSVRDELRDYVDTVHSEARRMITALSSDYRGVYYIDLDSGEGVCYQEHSEIADGPREGTRFPYMSVVTEYAEKYITDEYREDFLRFVGKESIRRALSNEKVITFRYMINRGGHETYEMIRAAALSSGENDDHAVHAVVAGFTDVDAETRENLSQSRVLADALAAAERANRAKTVFLNNMSHDIRTPMNAIIGFTALASSNLGNSRQVSEYLSMITVSSRHLLSLINDVLDMSRIESGKVTINPETIELPEIIHGLRTMIRTNAASKHLELYIYAQDIVHEKIITDKLRLNQILLNILSNAVKFTPNGGRIIFSVTELPPSDPLTAEFEFRIKDTGIGMSEEFRKTIFEAFTREQTSTVSGIQGTGLGMSITKNIVDMMGGSINVESETGKGSEFTVCIPCGISEDAETTETIPELTGKPALVISDDNSTRAPVCEMLGRLGMRPDGSETIISVGEYAAVIIDHTEKVSTDDIRTLAGTVGDNVPVIVLIDHDHDHLSGDDRITAVCVKPLFISELRTVLCDSAAVSAPAEEETEADFTGKHLLLAEDNEMNQIIASEILGSMGFTIDIADNGAEAVEKIKNAEAGFYDILLMDVQMPVMNGYEATKLIRSLDNRAKASVPIVAVTANAFEEDKHLAAEAGMNGHLAKPYDIPQIIEMLTKLIG